MSQLLKQTRQRVDKVLELVQALKEEDFPHADSTKTLLFVEKEFSEIQDTLTHLDPTLHDPRTIRANCRSALDDISDYLPVLGFVARSTDVVGALEMHRPLHRIVRGTVDADAYLLLTSDWDYSPYTYVHHRLIQEGIVLVGLPASEANNGLIMPLAGHEIGHNVWYGSGLDGHFAPIVSKTLVGFLTGEHFNGFQRYVGAIERNQVDDLAGRPYWEPAYAWTMAQCQEMFCDFVGLLLFRESYLYAFQYLLSPGGGSRDANYPSTRSRARHLVKAAQARGIEIEDSYAESFDEESSDAKGKDAFLLNISDLARESLIGQLTTMAEANLAACDRDVHSAEERGRVVAAFTRGTPVAGGVKLVNLVNAVWEIENAGIHIWDEEYPSLASQPEERSRVLNELFLKSLEVLEIEKLQSVSP
jgi:hypothetical protein